MSQHTPGPYTVDRDDNEFVVIHAPKRAQDLATIRLSEQTEVGGEDAQADAEFNAEMMANAYLFAAAPVMEDALRAVEALIESLWDKVNWGKSFLDATAIQQLNEVPRQVRAALAAAREEKP